MPRYLPYTPEDSSHQKYQGDVSDVHIIASLGSNTPYWRLWQPYLADWGQGHLVVCYGAQFQGKIDMGDILCQVSQDEGQSWSAPRPIFNHQQQQAGRAFGYLNPTLLQAPGTKTLWCFATRSPMYKVTGDDNELVAAYSVDGGWSWQEIPLAADFCSPVITTNAPVPIMRDGERRYLLPVHRGTMLRRDGAAGDVTTFILESPDLLHWRCTASIDTEPARQAMLVEAGLGVHPDGRLSLMHRAAKYAKQPVQILDQPCSYRSDSLDGGLTWSPAVPEPACYNSWSKAWYDVDTAGTERYIYSPGALMQREELLWISRPAGQSDWSDVRTFYDGNNRNSYPTLVPRAAGGWYAVWDSSADKDSWRTRICFGIFDPEI